MAKLKSGLSGAPFAKEEKLTSRLVRIKNILFFIKTDGEIK
jgi:hypothetical protein